MPDKLLSRERYGEAFWRAHHEGWRHSAFNQREYCEAQRIPLKAFGNWRAKFKAEPQPPSPKLLYRRRNLSHTLGHSLSHRLSHMTYGSPVQVPSCRRHASISARTSSGARVAGIMSCAQECATISWPASAIARMICGKCCARIPLVITLARILVRTSTSRSRSIPRLEP
jgi:hypothetical protein